MALKIRLTRGGAKKRPIYRIVIAEATSPRDGRFIERVGSYNPLLKRDDPNRVTLKTEEIQAWMKKGAQPTDRVARFLPGKPGAQLAQTGQQLRGRVGLHGEQSLRPCP